MAVYMYIWPYSSKGINKIRRDHLYIIEDVSNKTRRWMPKGQDEREKRSNTMLLLLYLYKCFRCWFSFTFFLSFWRILEIAELSKYISNILFISNHYVGDQKDRWMDSKMDWRIRTLTITLRKGLKRSKYLPMFFISVLL